VNLRNFNVSLMPPSLYDRLNPGIIHMLNPQPLPPGPPDPESKQHKLLNFGDAVSLNPQPLPPGPPDPEGVAKLNVNNLVEVLRAKTFSMLGW
jgi:hypothetical protein